ncbi:MAG: hypothetical protein IJ880_06155 [Bacilli bacterium]|nr:hypothetical protein [Bacilli bacterium]
MEKIKSWLLDVDEKNIIKRSTFWNLIASLLNSFMTAILLFFVTWINGVDKAGMFTIASAFAYQCLSLGNFGARNYHASDVKFEYSYSEYFYVRMISGVLMYSLLLWYTFGQGYTLEKALIVLAFGIFKSVDAFEDLIHGEFQRHNRLDIGCILQSFRYLASIIVFVLVLLITKSIILSCIIVSIVTFILLIVWNKPLIKKYFSKKKKFNKTKVKKLFLICLPICLGNAVNMYIVNCPKYMIDSVMASKFQTYFGIIFIPVFIINLLSTVIYRPYVKSLGDNWQDKDYKGFFKIVLRQVFIIVALTLLVIVFGYIIGLQIMGIIYGVKLNKYMLAFILLLVGGGLNSLASYFSVVLTAARAQNKLFIGYAITFIASFLISLSLVKSYGIDGASYVYVILNLITVVLFTIFMMIRYMQDRKVKKNG